MGSARYDRDYSGPEDLEAFLKFASATQTSKFPGSAAWHPGDIIWSLRGETEDIGGLHFWGTEDLEAVAWFDGPGDLWIEAHPTALNWIPVIVRWAEDAAARSASRLRVRLFTTDLARIEILEALGYRKGEPDMVLMRQDLSLSIPTPHLPIGMKIRDSLGIDPDLRAGCHRNAWDHLAHIGLERARSTFSAQDYLRLRESPGYDPTLDLLVETLDGQLVANCICWSDAPSRIGTFEPVGTHVNFRHKGLARALTLEGLSRLKAAGMSWARIGTAHFNAPAIATYLSSGFSITDHSFWWSRAPG